MVQLVDQLSRPSSRLKAVLDLVNEAAAEPSEAVPPSPVKRRIGNGVVLRAVSSALAEAGEPMQAKAVHAAVEALLGQAVSWSSVKATLANHATGPSPRFVRVARGRYGLASPKRSQPGQPGRIMSDSRPEEA